MRVIMISWEYPPVMVGGLGRHVYELCQHLAQQGHEILVLTRAISPDTTEEIEIISDRIRVIRAVNNSNISFTDDIISWTLTLGTSMLDSYLRLAADFNPDIIHAHDWIVAHPALAIAEYTHAPLIATIHATEAGRHSGWINTKISRHIHSIEWQLAHQADHVIVCSNFMRQELIDLTQIAPDHISVIPNGIDHDFWSFTPTAPVHLPELTQQLKLLFLGRLEYEKGVHDLIDSMPHILSIFPYATLDILGEGTQKNWLESLTRQHHITHVVHFSGYMPRELLRDHIDSHHIVILPSRYEPFGIVALEAAMRRKPLVVSENSGMSEFITPHNPPLDPDAYLGKICIPGNPPSIAQAVIDITHNYPTHIAKAQQLYAHASHKHYSWEYVSALTTEVYLRYLQSKHYPKNLTIPDFPERALMNRV